MRNYVTVEVDVDLDDVIDRLDEEDLKDLGFMKVGEAGAADERIRMACLRGDRPGFIEATARLLDAKGIFLRTDRLLPAVREVAHG